MFQVSAELVEKVVDDVSSEDSDARGVGLFHGFLGHDHIEGQNDCKFLAPLFEHRACPHDIPLVDRTDVDAGDRNLDCI